MADALRRSAPGGAGWKRHRGAAAAALIGLIMVLAACGSAAGGGKTGTGGGSTKGGTTVTAWLVTTGPSPANNAVNAAAKKFEASHPGDHITIDYVENQSFKQKIQLAMGAGNPPTLFWTWGGGILQQYIKAGDVQSLGNPGWASGFLPSSLGAVTFNHQLYGVPVEGTQPVYFFYNKQVFAHAGLSFPATWSALLADVHTLKAKGVAPISLANGDQWPGLMFLEYLTDRIGGPSVFKAIESGKAGAWSSPAMIQALTDIQQLVRAGAFQKGYDSLKFSGGGSDALVYSGKAAMQLMGDWDISSILGSNQSFVTGGKLGLAPFPAVAGGQGDPADLAGNTASYLAVASKATAAQKKIAIAFLQSVMPSATYAKAEVAAGEVPVTKGASPLFSGQQLASFDQTIYSSVGKAPSFQYSWDQSLGPDAAQAMLTNLAQVFELTQSPQKFASIMNKQQKS
ncbi:MAG TPA: extracellular solute-binding protein [Streptosporangiaceae bacterium]